MKINTKGSILAYSLLILAMMFAIIGSISAVSVLEKKSAGSSQSSSQAFQVADNAVQLALKKINSVIANNAITNKTIDAAFPGGLCTSNPATVSGTIDSDSGKPYVLTFYSTGSTTPIASCGELISNVDNIKSVGSFQNTSRAVNVAIAASGEFQASCAYGSSSIWCCKINRSDGDTVCKYQMGVSSPWNSASFKPWSSSTAGSYSLSCMANAAIYCCRTNNASGSTECKYTGAANLDWTSAASPF